MSCRFKGFQSKVLVAIATLIVVVNLPSATFSAERIDFNYSLLGFKVLVGDLETFADQGEISKNLALYLNRISPEQKDDLQKFLRQNYDVNPGLVYRYSRTTVGIKLLERIGDIIQLPGNLNGFYGLRAAVVQSALSDEGVNLIGFIKRFPTDIKLNLEEIITLIKDISRSKIDTKEFIASIDSNSINQTKANFKNTPDLSKPGKYKTTYQLLKLYDQERDRNLNTDLYLPQVKTKSIPVIVVSNGLGAKRDRFQALAQHLASYGFGVIIPDHPGSDRQRQKAFLQGLYQENFDATDFRDRPLDISYILDKLEILNQKQLNNQLNLEQVGIFGYSIGGTTALSLAGAKIDFARLEQECRQPLDLLNISTLYQCRALELPRNQESLQDERIKAAFLFVPFGNSIFSQSELSKVSIPMMWQVVDRDFLTSLLTEQVPLFNGLTNSESYLVISEKIPHSNVTLSKEQQSDQAKIFQIAKTYQNILSLVFFQHYVAQKPECDQYLTGKYLDQIEQKPYQLHLIKNEK